MKSISNALQTTFDMDAEQFEKERAIDLTWSGSHQFVRLTQEGRTGIAMSFNNLASKLELPLGLVTSGKQAVKIIDTLVKLTRGKR
jgi:hypothetical protein